LLVASYLAESQGGRDLVVLLPTGDEAEAETLERQARSILRKSKQSAEFRRVASHECGRVAAAVKAVYGGMLVVDTAGFSLHGEALEDFLDAVDCPVLLVR
jgi:hypothetical protein